MYIPIIMKKILLIFAFTVIYAHGFGQYKVADNGAIVVEEIVENTGLSISQTHDILAAYFANALNNSNRTQRLDTPDHLIYKGLISQDFNMGMLTYSVEIVVDIAIKDNRLRIRCEADNVSGGNVHGRKEYRLCETVPIAEKHRPTYTGLYKGQAESLFEHAVTGMNNIIANAKGALVKQSADNDW